MLKLTKEQKFLYSRIAILVAGVGWVAFAFAGLKGFPFWYGGFVLCFWLGTGLSNYPQKSSVWLFINKRHIFLLLWAACAGGAMLFDQFGLRAFLWFYPYYGEGLGLLWVYLVLYPFGGLACLELLYFVAYFLGERLQFVHRKMTSWHHMVDGFESVFFLAMAGSALLGILQKASASVVLSIALVWVLFAAIKLAFHIRHATQYVLIIVVSFLVAALLHEMPNTGAFEWVYLDAPILNQIFWFLPLWVWLGYSWLLLFTLRFWIFLVLHPKVK